MTLLHVTTVILHQLDEDRWSPTVPGLSERQLCKVMLPVRLLLSDPQPQRQGLRTGCGEGRARELMEQSEQTGTVGLERKESSRSVTRCLSMLES